MRGPFAHPILTLEVDAAATANRAGIKATSRPELQTWGIAPSRLYDSPEISGVKYYFTNTAFLYGAPFELDTTYRVKIVGTHAGGALNVEWTFTTGSQRPWGT